MDQANRFLKEVRIPAHNARFVLCWSGAPEDDASAFVPFAGSVRESLCIHADRIVGNDNTVPDQAPDVADPARPRSPS